MDRSYEVADRVKVLIRHTTKYKEEEKIWDDIYAGTILTYHEFVDENDENLWLYKVSVDGVGDPVVAKEVEGGQLVVVTDFNEKVS